MRDGDEKVQNLQTSQMKTFSERRINEADQAERIGGARLSSTQDVMRTTERLALVFWVLVPGGSRKLNELVRMMLLLVLSFPAVGRTFIYTLVQHFC